MVRNVIIAALAVASVLFAYHYRQAAKTVEQQSQLLIETREKAEKEIQSWLKSKRHGMQPSKPPRLRASACPRSRTRWQMPSKPRAKPMTPWTSRTTPWRRPKETEIKPWRPSQWNAVAPRASQNLPANRTKGR